MNLEMSDPWYIFDEDNNYEDAIMYKPEIKPIESTGSHRTGVIYGTTAREIEAVLGFPPNVQDDPDKVTVSWAFEMNGHKCAIWDYKGSLDFNQVSTFGNHDVFNELFGSKYFKD